MELEQQLQKLIDEAPQGGQHSATGAGDWVFTVEYRPKFSP